MERAATWVYIDGGKGRRGMAWLCPEQPGDESAWAEGPGPTIRRTAEAVTVGTAAIEHFLLRKVGSRLYWPFPFHVSRPNLIVPIGAVQIQGISMFVIWEGVKDYIMG